MYTITFNNSVGQLEQRTAKTGDEVAEAIIAMVQEAGTLYKGDNIVVTGDEDDE